jgi:hypothetical protein
MEEKSILELIKIPFLKDKYPDYYVEDVKVEKPKTLSNELIGGGLIYSFSPDGSLIETTSTENIVPAFMLNNYVFNNDGTVAFQTSSAADANKFSLSEDQLKDIIVGNPILKQYSPTINRNDVYIENGMLMLNFRRADDSVELYRMDIINSTVLVQAQFETPCPMRGTEIKYGFVSVPVDSEIGIKIISNPNYKVSVLDKLDPSVSIFRINQYSM